MAIDTVFLCATHRVTWFGRTVPSLRVERTTYGQHRFPIEGLTVSLSLPTAVIAGSVQGFPAVPVALDYALLMAPIYRRRYFADALPLCSALAMRAARVLRVKVVALGRLCIATV
jgi:hypothetical protein